MLGRLAEPSMDPGIGISFSDVDVQAWNRSGSGTSTVNAGDLVCFTFLNSNPIVASGEASVSIVPGAKNSVFANFNRAAAANDAQASFFGVAMETILGNKRGRVRVRGIVPKANVYHTSNSATSAGMALVANSTKATYLDALGRGTTATANRKILGLCLETLAASTSVGGQIAILFDGINGFGGSNG